MLDFQSQMIGIFECHLRIGSIICQHSEVYHPKEGYKSYNEVTQALIFEVLRTVEELWLNAHTL